MKTKINRDECMMVTKSKAEIVQDKTNVMQRKQKTKSITVCSRSQGQFNCLTFI